MSQLSKIVLGTRGSALALAQANIVKTAFERSPNPPSVELRVIKTTGDRRLDLSLSGHGQTFDKGLFTKELEEALVRKDIDIAVHSLKDLPTDLPPALKVGAVLSRHDPSDLLITKEPYDLSDLPQGAILATSSPRRALQLRYRRPDFKIVEVRGNVGTRLEKLLEQKLWTGLILAKAGVDRVGYQSEAGQLSIEGRLLHVRSLPEMLPAAGQGAIGLEIVANRNDVKEWVERLNDRKTWDAVTAERAFLKLLGGGCQTPIGVHGQYLGERFQLEAIVFDVNGKASTGFVIGCSPENAPTTLLKKIYGDKR
jgi:hydroxymethylbilane synthase